VPRNHKMPFETFCGGALSAVQSLPKADHHLIDPGEKRFRELPLIKLEQTVATRY